MTRMAVRWHLREVMATRGLFNTSDLVGPLAERGVHLSREQVYRLVTQTPQRLNMDVLGAVCDILDCGPQDLLEVVAAPKQGRKVVGDSSSGPASVREIKPVKARIRRPSKPS